ncbi:AraC family transcriptional regulator [Ruficoccus sp. ZRK36]|uniref:helix-turn-helix transcriptional regulator n=1 Tax=Ruficoccus sp. ZRK36 TaxID=2866311 RepID=UPI001C73D4D7|nr:AraC family transcriptional regulator [Ruficoccus sp. ZRK36]QYY36690.1 AraC family transcriptional regulator [Ruficoccus sp. ZRK36]
MLREASRSTLPNFRLSQWVTLRLQLLWVYEKAMVKEATSTSQSEYGFQSALLVHKGWALAGESESGARRAGPGQWLFLRQGKRWQRFSADCELLSIGYRFQYPTGEAVYDEGLPLVVDAADCLQLEREARKVLRTVKRHIGLGFYLGERVVDMRAYLLTQNAFRLFLVELAEVYAAEGLSRRDLREPSQYVLRALDLIQGVPSGRSVKSADIAHAAGLSQTHLDRLMVQDTGHTVHQQIELRRLQLAQDALQAGAVPLKTIAYDLGFCSPSHFHSWFRKRQGVTPAQFRRRNVW